MATIFASKTLNFPIIYQNFETCNVYNINTFVYRTKYIRVRIIIWRFLGQCQKSFSRRPTGRQYKTQFKAAANYYQLYILIQVIAIIIIFIYRDIASHFVIEDDDNRFITMHIEKSIMYNCSTGTIYIFYTNELQASALRKSNNIITYYTILHRECLWKMRKETIKYLSDQTGRVWV